MAPKKKDAPDGDDWEWKLIDIECGACGATNQIHEQKPEWLEEPAGVKWECNNCGAANKLGGHEILPPADYVLECVNCHATFDPNTIEQADDGTWTCPACDVEQKHIRLSESASSTQRGSKR